MVKIFGILNVTPDSFSDGGKFDSVEKALAQADNLFADGADFVDVGGESTRPGARPLSVEEEWGRLVGFFNGLGSRLRGNDRMNIENFSLDTRKPELAERFLELGGTIINDVSGFQDPRMIELVARYDVWGIVNHFPGTSVDKVHEQEICSIKKVQDDLLTRKEKMIAAGIDPKKIILDPGIGFGKTMELNWELLEFSSLVPDEKVMIGHSKKRFLGKNRMKQSVNVEAAQTAVDAGAWALRVHDTNWY